MMNNLWKKRVAQHQKKMMRYLKYVLNDHFVIVCLFLVGALGYVYSESLKSLPENFRYAKWIAVVVFTGMLFIGKLATLLQSADTVFLLPKEKELKGYLHLAKRYSSLLPISVILLGSGITMPLLVAAKAFNFADMLYFVVYLFLMKNSEFDIQGFCMRLSSSAARRKMKFLFFIAALVGSTLLVFVSPFLGIGYAVLLQFGWYRYELTLSEGLPYQWQQMVTQESQRVQRIYQFINLFTDVPILKSSTKRRRYMDVFLKNSKKEHKNTFYYLYTRAFIRGTEYSGLFFRLAIITIGLTVFVKPFLLNLFLAVVFLYLTGFQLAPLYFHFDNNAVTVLYPVDQNQKLKAIKKTILVILIGESCGIGIAALFVFTLSESLAFIILMFLFCIFFSYFYLPKRIKKMEKTRYF